MQPAMNDFLHYLSDNQYTEIFFAFPQPQSRDEQTYSKRPLTI